MTERVTAPGREPLRGNVEVPAAQRIQRRLASAREAGDRQAGGPAQPRHQGLTAPQQRSRPLRLEGQQLPQLGPRGHAAQVRLAAPEAGEILGRQVDATSGVVLRHILQMLHDLERRADGVGERDVFDRGSARDMQHELAHGVRRERAVTQQRLEGLVALNPLIASVRLDQPLEGLARKPVSAQCRSQLLKQRMPRRPREGAIQVLLQRVEAREPVAFDLVAQVVSQPRKAVESQKIAAQAGWKPAKRDREVLVASLCPYRVRVEQPVRLRAARRAGQLLGSVPSTCSASSRRPLLRSSRLAGFVSRSPRSRLPSSNAMKAAASSPA